MVRGLERRIIFRDDSDRADFVSRLKRLVESGALAVYAWALLPNHVHLLVRTGTRPLPRSMRSLLTGYAGAFNRRHKRVGHLFQNRYKSIVVEEEPYLLELVRYLHLNPIRVQSVADLSGLDRFPWTGHSALVGTVPRPWQDTTTILAQFGPTPGRARRAYRTYVSEGIPRGRRPDLQGGGLIRSAGGWEAVAALRRGREAYLGDERILGGTEFVEFWQRSVEGAARSATRRIELLEELIARVCHAAGISVDQLARGFRPRAVSRARNGIAYLWTEVLGRPARPLASVLGIRPQSVYQAIKRGRAAREEWERLLDR
jgi:REP element-mobilizing transposase RayT